MNAVHKALAAPAMMAAALFTAVPVALADDATDKAIKARRGAMQLYSHYAGPLFAMAKGDLEYDSALAAQLAENLNTVANLSGARMWPPDSHNEAREGKTRAKATIWEAGSEVGEKSQAMKDAALEISLVAGDGLDSLRDAVRSVGGSCKGCHDDYRAKDF